MMRSASLLVLAWLLLAPVDSVRGDLHESFESATPSWKLAERDCGLQLIDQRRLFGQARSGHGCEWLDYACGQGSFAYLVHPILHTRVIDELSIGVWVRGNRRGIQLLARVVLPRSLNPESGKPISTLIYGTVYQEVGSWQQLRLDDPAEKLRQQVFSLRSQYGSHVDPAEAYVDLVVLNAYGGAGRHQLSLDDLDVQGQVLRDPSANVSRLVSDRSSETGEGWTDGGVRAEFESGLPGLAGSRSATPALPRWRGSVLYVEGRPFALRAIDYQGESLGYLRDLGFNAIVIESAPTAELAAAAEQAKLWIVAPAPLSSDPPLSSYRRVVAWHLGSRLQQGELEPTRDRVLDTRRENGGETQPLVAPVHSGAFEFSQVLDTVIFDREPLGSSLSLEAYSAWLTQQTSKLRLGSPFWATVQTQAPPELVEQITAFGGQDESDWIVTPGQIRQMAVRAVMAGARGVWFRSRNSLETSDAATRQRARALQLVNFELQRFEPWIAGGEVVGPIETGIPDCRAVLLRTDRARLVIVLRHGPKDQFAMSPVPPGLLSFEVHGIPITDEAYQLTPTGLRRLVSERGTGVRVRLDQAQPITAVLLTQDPLALQFAAQKIKEQRQVFRDLVHELVGQQFVWTQTTQRRLAQLVQGVPAAEAELERAQREFQYLEDLLASGGQQEALQVAERITNILHQVQRSYWEWAAVAFTSPVASPCCVSFSTLPLHWMTARRLLNAGWSANVLPAGDFEDLQHLRQSGWTYEGVAEASLKTEVIVDYAHPRSGRGALLLSATPARPDLVPRVEQSPIRITTSPIPVQNGQMVRVEGWIHVPVEPQGTVDGLLVYDTLGGRPLAVRLKQTTGWQPLTLYRMAAGDGQLQVTVELTGLGQVLLDDFSVRILE